MTNPGCDGVTGSADGEGHSGHVEFNHVMEKHQGDLWLPEISYISMDVTTWMSNHIYVTIRDVIIQACSSMTSVVAHYSDVIMSTMASQVTSFTIVYWTIYLGIYQRKHQSPASLAFVRGIHRWLVNSPYKGPIMWKMFSFDDVIMLYEWPFNLRHVILHFTSHSERYKISMLLSEWNT